MTPLSPLARQRAGGSSGGSSGGGGSSGSSKAAWLLGLLDRWLLELSLGEWCVWVTCWLHVGHTTAVATSNAGDTCEKLRAAVCGCGCG